MTDQISETPESVEIPDELRGKDPKDVTDGVVPDELRGKTPEELQAIAEIFEAHARALHQTDEGELRVKTPDEQKAFDYAIKIRNKAIDLLDEHRAISEVFRRRPKAVVQAMQRVQYGDGGLHDVRRLTNHEARDRALRALDSRDATAHMSDSQKVQVERSLRRDPDIARRIIVTENEHYRSAWMKLVTQIHPMLDDEERQAIQAWESYRAMAEGSPDTGGYGVPVFIDPSIILTAQESGNPFLQVCRQVTVMTNEWKGVSSAGVTWSFDAEASEVSDDSPELAQPNVEIHSARGFIPYSIEIGQDYPGFAEEMSRLLAEGYDELLVEKFSTGGGSGEPHGILTALDANTNVEILTDTSGAFNVEDLYKVWKSLPQKYRRNANWMMSEDVNGRVRQFGTDHYHAQTENLRAERADVLFGRVVLENAYFPDVVVSSTTDSNLLVVGDFRNYVIARRGGMTVEFVPHLFGNSHRPTGQRGWFAHARIGGDVVNDVAFRLLQLTRTT